MRLKRKIFGGDNLHLTARSQLAEQLFSKQQDRLFVRTDRLFACLLIAEWIAGIIASIFFSPLAWAGTTSSLHSHFWTAIFLGAAIISFPVTLVWLKPGTPLTRHVIAGAQMLISALLIHLSGGRIETHFHVFGSLAFLAFYRDWRVMLTATLVISIDHLLRGVFWPESVYGILTPTFWRSMEHAAWVVFEDVFLIWSCAQSVKDMRQMADKQAKLETTQVLIEAQVIERTRELSVAMDELENREARLKAILETAADAILSVDDRGLIMTANSAAEKLFGCTAHSLLSQPITMFLPESKNGSVGDYLAHPAESLESQMHFETLGRREDGTEITVELTLSQTRTETNRVFIVIVRDVTQRRQMEQQLQQAQKMESIGQLAAGIAHEINTPIQYVGHNAKFLKDEFCAIEKILRLAGQSNQGNFSEQALQIIEPSEIDYLCEEIPKAINESIEGVQRVSRIVQAMKEFSHPGSRDKQLVDINKLVENAIVVSTNEWKYTAELEMEWHEGLPQVSCLAGELSQAILNLIVNAAHAIQDMQKKSGNAALGKIHVSTKPGVGTVEIRIGDSGCGIPEQYASRIFEPFFTTKDVGKGKGQGLSIVWAVIVNKHNGSLRFESEENKGTAFIITLPASLSASSAPNLAEAIQVPPNP